MKAASCCVKSALLILSLFADSFTLFDAVRACGRTWSGG
jgi:hypothetical protein